MPDFLSKSVSELGSPARAPFTTSERVYWLYLLAAVVLAVIVFAMQAPRGSRSARGFFAYLFPKTIYGHRSTFVDFSFFGVNKILYWLLVVPWFVELPAAAHVVTSALGRAFPERAIVTTSSLRVDIAFTLVTAVALDLGLFLGHWLMHKVPLLWEFHKVHHSAEVMTPVTVYRQHPIDDIVNISVSAVCGAVAQGAFVLATGRTPQIIAIYGLNVLVLGFYIFGYNLRHSHVWLSYGPTINKIFISPAQHQVHHSENPAHFDKNMGFIFAFWDRVAGTLYVPLQKEELTFGLGTDEDREFHSLWRLYTRPFVSVFRHRSKMLVMNNSTRAVLLLVVGAMLALIVGAHTLGSAAAHDGAANEKGAALTQR